MGDAQCEVRYFHVWLDINLNAQRAQDMVKYMEDGLYIDDQTKQVTVQLVTYNAQLHFFANSEINFQFEDTYGGLINIVKSVQTVNIELYTTFSGQVRAVFEMMFLVLVMLSAVNEGREAYHIYQETGSVAGYFKSGWNYIDITSIGMNFVTLCLWINFIFTDARTFSMEPRYHAMASLTGKGRWLMRNQDNVEDFDRVINRFQEMSRMTDFQVEYMMQNGLNSFFLIMRILKLCDFQPRMGIITRTLAVAASDLYHFFLLLFIIFIGYTITGHLLFGTTLY
eukprot:gene15579-18470_t